MALLVVPARAKLLVVAALLALPGAFGCLMNPHRGERLGLEPAREPVGTPGGEGTPQEDGATGEEPARPDAAPADARLDSAAADGGAAPYDADEPEAAEAGAEAAPAEAAPAEVDAGVTGEDAPPDAAALDGGCAGDC
jgi:hypothetical protein